MNPSFISHLFNIQSDQEFNECSIELFQFQAKNNPVYQSYLYHLGVDPKKISNIYQIPFLPISFFKTHKVLCKNESKSLVFESSGTTGMTRSKHYVPDINLYRQSYLSNFKQVYGPPEDYCFLALLPGYLERSNSSLIHMVNGLIELGHPKSGFFLDDHETLHQTILEMNANEQPTILIGVSFALLDFTEKYQPKLQHTIVMETGGMKGRRKEMIRTELHVLLKARFQVAPIHSEYGMTELLSQAYAKKDGFFRTPGWMKVFIRSMDDPFEYVSDGRSGGINIIDLANVYSCSFIETKDIGRISANHFEVLGRFDISDIRGCNLMINH